MSIGGNQVVEHPKGAMRTETIEDGHDVSTAHWLIDRMMSEEMCAKSKTTPLGVHPNSGLVAIVPFYVNIGDTIAA